MFLDLIQKLLGVKKDLSILNKPVKSANQVSAKNVKYSTPVLELNNSNIVHPELKTEKEINDLYDEIRVLQEKNREKIDRNKISYNIRK